MPSGFVRDDFGVCFDELLWSFQHFLGQNGDNCYEMKKKQVFFTKKRANLKKMK